MNGQEKNRLKSRKRRAISLARKWISEEFSNKKICLDMDMSNSSSEEESNSDKIEKRTISSELDEGDGEEKEESEEESDEGGGEENEESEEESDDEDVVDEIDEILKLKNWAIECQIHQNDLDKLLEILRFKLLPSLPKSSKTFLRTTDAEYKIEEMEDSEGGIGSFVYMGLENGLKNCVNEKLHKDNVIELQIHADGMPVSKSGTDSFWVLSAKVHYEPDVYEPFVIGIFQGQNKPKTPQVFLDRFVYEFNSLYKNGLHMSGKTFEVRIKCIIGDTPARAYLKNTVGHKAKFACERCTVEGKSIKGTTVFPDADKCERSDESFRKFEQPEHHHGPSPFLRIVMLINIISVFVLDFMHLCCQGVMKKLLEYWMSTNRKYRLTLDQRKRLSKRLEDIKSEIPCEFQRKTRGLKGYLKFKATEFRFLLLYSGPVILKGLLKDELYKHFLLFHSACRILSSARVCLKYANDAKKYLRTFFIQMVQLYGARS
ncbi:uncharacterized protein LOC127289494 [Leptopilina boulardi]|uniref:uncharacterized protein LOC127289494 n=1 Tax=Leptopilina boulardi TaxID=63433 RepID=UPI0021F61247|nr:uncharacterized protein LOC127289494 [Leptopilina boulardi]